MTQLTNGALYMFGSFKRALERVVAFGQQAEPGQICFCIGAGGSGKSRLAALIGPAIFGKTENWRSFTTPYLHIAADNPDSGYFSTKWFIHQCLSNLGDPFRALPQALANSGLDATVQAALLNEARRKSDKAMSEPSMRETFIRLARARELRLMVIDEANLLTFTRQGRVPTDYLEGIRRLGDQIGCPIVLLGTIRMLELLGYSAQLNRRMFLIHLARMSCRSDEEKSEFVSFLNNIETDFGLSAKVSSQASRMFTWTYGIPGEIIGIVQRAMMVRGVQAAAELTWDDIADARQTNAALRQMRDEADLIESALGEGVEFEEPLKMLASRPKRASPRRKLQG